MAGQVPVHVEVAISSGCTLSGQEVGALVAAHLKNNIPVFRNGPIDLIDDAQLAGCVDFVLVSDLKPADAVVSFWQADLAIHPYRLLDSEPEKDYLEGEDALPACEQWELPNKHLAGLWESIVLDDSIKSRLLGYCGSSIAFSDASVDSNVISWNRMAMLYGPPGTGKTTLCKALAQKMYIRHCSSRYSAGVLLEINSHSLFSKWFSESGKLVMKLFDHIHEIADDAQTFVTVLIDEVESIAMSRSSTARSNEPGDAVRVVNSVLTSLDALRRRPNVLVLCTSNLASGIDAAFQDRLDLQLYLGPPALEARYGILHSCLAELMGRGLIQVRPSVCPTGCILSVAVSVSVPGASALLGLPLTSSLPPLPPSPPSPSLAPQPAVELSPDVDSAARAYQLKVDGGLGVDAVEIHERAPAGMSVDGNASAVGNGHGHGNGHGNGIGHGHSGNGQGHGHSNGQGSVPMEEQGASSYAGAGAGGARGGARGDSFSGSGVFARLSASGFMNTQHSDSVREVHLTAEELLFLVASQAEGMSGRALRKLPLKAHAFYLQKPVSDATEFLWAMQTCMEESAAAKDNHVGGVEM